MKNRPCPSWVVTTKRRWRTRRSYLNAFKNNCSKLNICIWYWQQNEYKNHFKIFQSVFPIFLQCTFPFIVWKKHTRITWPSNFKRESGWELPIYFAAVYLSQLYKCFCNFRRLVRSTFSWKPRLNFVPNTRRIFFTHNLNHLNSVGIFGAVSLKINSLRNNVA